ncbi:hypothetical protein EOL73_00250 [Candidatus Saccharibacteria bacterium]|nr:hypothetical protein [Candidatus Saccharibacteria bacterium]
MDKGFIKLYRKYQQNEFWTERREFSKFEAWLDLLTTAKTVVKEDDKPLILGSEEVWVARGQVCMSMVTLASRWGWSKSKVKRVLDLFQKRNMIRLKGEAKMTRITICNYETYNEVRNADETQMKRKRNGDETEMDTNKKVEKEEKEKKVKNNNNIYSAEFESVWESYGYIGTKAESYRHWKKLSDEDKNAIIEFIPKYLEVYDSGYITGFHKMINPKDRLWEDKTREVERRLAIRKPPQQDKITNLFAQMNEQKRGLI